MFVCSCMSWIVYRKIMLVDNSIMFLLGPVANNKNMLMSSFFFVYCIKIVVIRLLLYCGQGAISQPQKLPSQTDAQQGNSFTLQLFQRTLEETLATFQKSVHEDMRNLHIEILRQFHMQEVHTHYCFSFFIF